MRKGDLMKQLIYITCIICSDVLKNQDKSICEKCQNLLDKIGGI